jgi:hypothetical protein
MPLIKGPFCFIVTSRGCPAGCTYCIKHVSYGPTMRLRSPHLLVEEIRQLGELGVHNIHMYADLFTVNRDQVVGLCQGLIEANLKIRWTCNSRVDFVDREMLQLMAKSGCYYIAWGLESGNKEILRTRARASIPNARSSRSAGRARPASRTGATSSSACPARPRRPSGRPSTSRRACRSTSPCSTSRRPIRARRSSTRSCARTAGSGRGALGRGGHGRVHGARLSEPLGRTARVLAEARVP